MLQRIKTEEGERWAVVFNEYATLEDIGDCIHGLIDLLNCATSSELFESSQSAYISGLYILNELTPNATQMLKCERILNKVGWTF